MGVEVVISGQQLCAYQFPLQHGDEVQQVFRLAAADVVQRVGGNGQAVLAFSAFGRALHHPIDALHDVVNVGEVPQAITVVEYADGLAPQQLLRGGIVEHVRPPRGTVDGEEPQAGAGDVVELGIAVGQQLVGFFCGGVQADGVVHPVVGVEGYLLIAAIYR